MGGVYKRSRSHMGNKDVRKKFRLRKRTKDLDEIITTLQKKEEIIRSSCGTIKEEDLIVRDEDLAGDGLHSCQECNRNFVDQNTLAIHYKTKYHKKRLKGLYTGGGPYTIKEAKAAAGDGSNEFYSKK